MRTLSRVLGTAAAVGTMLLAAAIPASATPAQANYSGTAGSWNVYEADQAAYNDALAKAQAAGFSSSQCLEVGQPQDLNRPPYGQPQYYFSMGVQIQCTTQPAPGTVNLNRYYRFGGFEHMSTTGSAPSGYYLDGSLGWLYSSQVSGTVPLYMCQMVNSVDSFSSPAANCEGQQYVGLLGYIYTAPPAGVASRLVRRCMINGTHFDSNDVNCEGQVAEGILGYSLD